MFHIDAVVEGVRSRFMLVVLGMGVSSGPVCGQPVEAVSGSEPLTAAVAGEAVERPFRRWSISFGVARISDDTPGDYYDLDVDRLGGDGGGLTYNLTATYTWREFQWRVLGVNLRPQLEVPAMLTLVDDRVQGIIPDLNAGLVFRWRNFPWNRYLATSLAAGVGLSYSFDVWTADYLRHPGEDRSKWKFWMPIDLSVALPRWRQHELFLFIDHQSGGRIFDYGGIDAWGAGYRFRF